MTGIASFTFNPFYENTYVVYDKTGDCVIIDPGCYTREEKDELQDFITRQKLRPVYLLNTHCHVDHVLGNHFVAETWKVPLLMHKRETEVLQRVKEYAPSMGIVYEPSPDPAAYLDEQQILAFGETSFKVLYTPGHSPASICFYCEEGKFIVSGDVLFYDSIGRTDLPGGDYNTLIQSIRTQLFVLPDDVKVYPGHMQPTTIGREKEFNPFLSGTFA